MAESKKTIIRSKEYPGATLNQAIEFVVGLKDFPMSKPLTYDAAAKALNTSINTKSFKFKLSAAKQYGLISLSSGKTFSFLEISKHFLFPHESEKEIEKLKKKCFSNPTLYAELIKDYEGKSLPLGSTLANIFISQYGIAPAASESAAFTFLKSAEQAGAMISGVLNLSEDIENDMGEKTEEDKDIDDEKGLRQVEYNEKKQDYTNNNVISVIESSNQETFRIPLGRKENATLNFPESMSKETAQYLNFMIYQMLKNLYGID